jgi:predicted dehydrogenase
MFDMGTYNLTALVNLLGPVKRVTASARASFPERTATSKDLYGMKIKVEVPTHVTGVMDFASGAIGNIIMSFDTWAHNLPRLEIYGSEGSLSVPDPNTFGGPVKIRKANDKDWQDVPLTHGYTDNMRGIGVADMAYALRSGRPNRVSGALAYHVLDLMQSFHEASERGQHVAIQSNVAKPAPLPVGLEHGKLDD